MDLHLALPYELLVDLHFFVHPQVVRYWYNHDAGAEGLISGVAYEFPVFSWIGMGYHHLIGGDEGKAPHLEIALLGKAQKVV